MNIHNQGIIQKFIYCHFHSIEIIALNPPIGVVYYTLAYFYVSIVIKLNIKSIKVEMYKRTPFSVL